VIKSRVSANEKLSLYRDGGILSERKWTLNDVYYNAIIKSCRTRGKTTIGKLLSLMYVHF